MMKHKIYFFFLISLIFLASCGSGLSEEEKILIENTEENWKVNHEMADYLSGKLDEIERLIAIPEDTLAGAGTDSLQPVENIHQPVFDNLRHKHADFVNGLHKEDKKWAEFKNKAMKGEISSEELETKLSEKNQTCVDRQKTVSKFIKESEELLKKIKKDK